MPTKSKHPQHVIDSFVARYFRGEPVTALHKEAGISRASMYLWINKSLEDPKPTISPGERRIQALERRIRLIRKRGEMDVNPS